MKVRFIHEKKKEFDMVWTKHIKVFYISFWFFGIQLSFGKKPFDAIAYREFLDEQFNKNCEVCGKSLQVQNIGQIVRYHKECKKFRNK